MLFKPRWARILLESPNLRISDGKIKQIEYLRKECGLPHEYMARIVGNSKAMTRIVQRNILEAHKRIVAEASEKELWLLVLLSRIESHENFVLHSAETGEISESEVVLKFDLLVNAREEAKERIEKMNSFEMLCDYIVSLDEEIVGRRYAQEELEAPQGLAKRISDILEKD